VVAEQPSHGHSSNALQLITRESQIFVISFVVEAVTELPIPELLGDDAFKKIILIFLSAGNAQLQRMLLIKIFFSFVVERQKIRRKPNFFKRIY
jgi:hypothetical protein